jgi:hypothetical protein
LFGTSIIIITIAIAEYCAVLREIFNRTTVYFGFALFVTGAEEGFLAWLISEVKQEINQMVNSRELLTGSFFAYGHRRVAINNPHFP